ncbi:MAG: hypothetical protein U5K37_04170 [Natrialbaceae archaeon]|nr:hypothetical protein [Natrialbaceae archaeon]
MRDEPHVVERRRPRARSRTSSVCGVDVVLLPGGVERPLEFRSWNSSVQTSVSGR